MTNGLRGVIVAETVLSDVDGAGGRLTLRGKSVGELARMGQPEVAAHLLRGLLEPGLGLLLGGPACDVVGPETRPAPRAHDPDHRPLGRVGQQPIRRLAHRSHLRPVVADGHPRPQAPAADERMTPGHAAALAARRRAALTRGPPRRVSGRRRGAGPRA